jgi:hypothetical protein
MESSNMQKTALALAAVATFAFSAPALAHHSAAPFDFTRTAQMTGVVKDFQLINPHMRLTMVVNDSAHGPHDVDFEGHSLNIMYRGGWRKDMIKPGDKITVIMAPMKDGSEGGFVTAVVTASGQRVGMVSSAEAAKTANQ